MPAAIHSFDKATVAALNAPLVAPYTTLPGDGLSASTEPIITTEGYGIIPAKDVCEKLGVTDQIDSKLEEATEELYLKEFVNGKLNEKCGDFVNEKVEFGRNKVRDWLKDKNQLESFPTLQNAPIRCRCGAECVVKILNNQWFLNYGDEEWKNRQTRFVRPVYTDQVLRLKFTISDKRDIDEEYGLISVDFEATFEDGELVLTSKRNLYRIKKEPPNR